MQRGGRRNTNNNSRNKDSAPFEITTPPREERHHSNQNGSWNNHKNWNEDVSVSSNNQSGENNVRKSPQTSGDDVERQLRDRLRNMSISSQPQSKQNRSQNSSSRESFDGGRNNSSVSENTDTIKTTPRGRGSVKYRRDDEEQEKDYSNNANNNNGEKERDRNFDIEKTPTKDNQNYNNDNGNRGDSFNDGGRKSGSSSLETTPNNDNNKQQQTKRTPNSNQRSPAQGDWIIENTIELKNIPENMNHNRLEALFERYKRGGIRLKWVNDSCCLVSFRYDDDVQHALDFVEFGDIDVTPLTDASDESRHAFDHGKPGDPLRSSPKLTDRPQTTNAVARRLIAGSLGITLPRQKTDEEKRLDKLRAEKRKQQNDN